MTIANSAETIKPLVKGDSIPNAKLVSSKKESTTLYELVNDKPAVVVFYRGNW